MTSPQPSNCLNTFIQLAAADPPWVVPAISAVVITGMVLLVLTLIWFIRFFLRRGAEALKRAYDGIENHPEPLPGCVPIVFHTYYGFGGGGYQCEHRVYLKPDDAECLLRRLHSFNLRWGWFCPGGIFVPFISYASYRSQLKKIKKPA